MSAACQWAGVGQGWVPDLERSTTVTLDATGAEERLGQPVLARDSADVLRQVVRGWFGLRAGPAQSLVLPAVSSPGAS
jgi:hypothetical protein